MNEFPRGTSAIRLDRFFWIKTYNIINLYIWVFCRGSLIPQEGSSQVSETHSASANDEFFAIAINFSISKRIGSSGANHTYLVFKRCCNLSDKLGTKTGKCSLPLVFEIERWFIYFV